MDKNPYSATTNLRLKNGIVRFDKLWPGVGATPIPVGHYGVFVDSLGDLYYVKNGVASKLNGQSGSLPALPDGEIFVGNALNAATAVPMSGDATIDNTGVMTLAESVRVIREKITISSAQILNSNSVPVGVIPSPGVGKFLDILSITVQKNFVTSAYDTNTNALFVIGTGGVASLDLSFSASALDKRGIRDFATLDIAANSGLFFETETGNPANGDGDLEVYVAYQIVTL